MCVDCASEIGKIAEKSSEFKRKKDAGESPYPAKAPWYPAAAGLTFRRMKQDSADLQHCPVFSPCIALRFRKK